MIEKIIAFVIWTAYIGFVCYQFGLATGETKGFIDCLHNVYEPFVKKIQASGDASEDAERKEE